MVIYFPRYIVLLSVVAAVICVCSGSYACIPTEVLERSNSEDFPLLQRADKDCRKGFAALQKGQYADAMALLEATKPYEKFLVWPWRLAWAESLFGAGAPVERTLLAWEEVKEPTALVKARRHELVERLDIGRASVLLNTNPARSSAAWLRARAAEDQSFNRRQKKVGNAVQVARVIGVLLPLSGRLKTVGTAILDGMRMRLDDTTRLIIRDTHGLKTAAVRQLVEELAKAPVIAIVGAVDTRIIGAVTKACASAKIPLLAMSPQAVQGKGVFRAFVSRVAHCIALIERATAEGARRFAIIGADSAYGRALSTAFATAVERVGGTLVTAVECRSGQLDLARPSRRLSRRRFDALFVADEPSRAGSVLRYVARAGILSRGAGAVGERHDVRYVQMLAPSEWLGHLISADDAQYLAGTWIATEWSGEQAPEARPLTTALRDRLSTRATLFHAVGYDALGILQQVGLSDAKSIAQQLKRQVFSGVLGRMRFAANGDTRRDLRIYRVAGRGYKRVGTTRIAN